MTTAVTPTTTQTAPRRRRKIRTGVVTSNRMTKTIVVRVTRLVRHPKYNRVVRQVNSFKAHDDTNQAAIGDWVKIMECRPLSKDKRWRLVEIVRRASTAPPVPDAEVEPVAKNPAARSPAEAAAEPDRTTQKAPSA